MPHESSHSALIQDNNFVTSTSPQKVCPVDPSKSRQTQDEECNKGGSNESRNNPEIYNCVNRVSKGETFQGGKRKVKRKHTHSKKPTRTTSRLANMDERVDDKGVLKKIEIIKIKVRKNMKPKYMKTKMKIKTEVVKKIPEKIPNASRMEIMKLNSFQTFFYNN